MEHRTGAPRQHAAGTSPAGSCYLWQDEGATEPGGTLIFYLQLYECKDVFLQLLSITPPFFLWLIAFLSPQSDRCPLSLHEVSNSGEKLRVGCEQV